MQNDLYEILSKKDVFLMDFDGTIADTEPLNFLTLKTLLKRDGLEFTDEHFRQMVGKSAFEYLDLINKIFGTHYTTENEGKLYIDTFKEIAHTHALPVFKYIGELLQTFPNKRKIILSNQSDSVIRDILSNCGIVDEFENIVSCFVKQIKKQDYYLNTKEFLNAEPDKIVLFEDSQRYIDNGKSAGFTTIGVTNIYNGGKLKADLIIEGQ